MTSTIINTMGPGIICKRFIVTYSDLTTAGTSQTLVLDSAIPKGSMYAGCRALCVTAFAGGSISAMTLALGAGSIATNTFLTAQTVFTGITAGVTQYSGTATGMVAFTYAGDTFTATFASTTDNVNASTAGSVYIDLFYIPFENLVSTGPAGNSTTGGGLL